MLRNILNSINEGVVILDKDLEILFWNDYMKLLVGIDFDIAFKKQLYEIMPSLNKSYFNHSIGDILNNGSKFFFSAALHKDLIKTSYKTNLKASKVEYNHKTYILLEFIDVTSQFLRINQLESSLRKLTQLNDELKEKEKKINSLAYYDSLTGVANRVQFYRMAKNFLLSLPEIAQQTVGIIFIDIDNFKEINDTYGHNIGDEVIVDVSKSLVNATRSSDLVARFGGDEFLILFSANAPQDVNLIAERILKNSAVFQVENHLIGISLSVGISLWRGKDESIDELIAEADKAMYIAKRQGGNDWHLWE